MPAKKTAKAKQEDVADHDDEAPVSGADAKLAALVEELDVEGGNIFLLTPPIQPPPPLPSHKFRGGRQHMPIQSPRACGLCTGGASCLAPSNFLAEPASE